MSTIRNGQTFVLTCVLLALSLLLVDIAMCGPLDMDDLQPAITVMMPDED